MPPKPLSRRERRELYTTLAGEVRYDSQRDKKMDDLIVYPDP